MKKIGITGKNGFIGYHLTETIKLYINEFEIVHFERGFFNNPEALDNFVSSCDVIVHLAALNRHNDPDEIYEVNTRLTQRLLESLVRTGKKPHVLVSSSTQEYRDNQYGKSKRYTRETLAKWAKMVGAKFTGLIVPNVFGPFGHPFYNSVVATFCHQLAHDKEPKIDVDAELKLIYVGELIDIIINCINRGNHKERMKVSHTSKLKVSEIMIMVKEFKTIYQEKGEIPLLQSSFEQNLFNTFRCYMPKAEYFPRLYTNHLDNRGNFVELMRAGIPGQTSYSITNPGITRGEHYHTRKIERFAVIQGKARIQFRRVGTEEIFEFNLNGNHPSYVDMPIWYTHNITNIGGEDLITVFWINEPYNPDDPDTWFEKV